MTGPVEFDAGGSVRYVVDTTVNYVSPSSMRGYLSGDQRMNATQAEKAKESKIRREVEQGVRSPLRAGFTFVPAGITSRGVLGAGMERLLGMLAEYGAMNRGVLTYLGERGRNDGANVKTNLIQRWTQRMSVAMHRAAMEAVWFRVMDIERALKAKDDEQAALTGIEIRFGGNLGVEGGE